MSVSQGTQNNKRMVDGNSRGDTKRGGCNCVVAMVNGAFHFDSHVITSLPPQILHF
jgi:hypothetical protein